MANSKSLAAPVVVAVVAAAAYGLKYVWTRKSITSSTSSSSTPSTSSCASSTPASETTSASAAPANLSSSASASSSSSTSSLGPSASPVSPTEAGSASANSAASSTSSSSSSFSPSTSSPTTSPSSSPSSPSSSAPAGDDSDFVCSSPVSGESCCSSFPASPCDCACVSMSPSASCCSSLESSNMNTLESSKKIDDNCDNERDEACEDNVDGDGDAAESQGEVVREKVVENDSKVDSIQIEGENTVEKEKEEENDKIKHNYNKNTQNLKNEGEGEQENGSVQEQDNRGTGEEATEVEQEREPEAAHTDSKREKLRSVTVLYGSGTGTGKGFAERLTKDIFALNASGRVQVAVEIHNLKDYDQDNLEYEDMVVLFLSTWTGGTPPQDAEVFCQWLFDQANDFRVSKTFLSKVRFAIFALGSCEYDEQFCKAARDVEEHLCGLGASFLDDSALADDTQDQEKQYESWSMNVLAMISSAVINDVQSETGESNTRSKSRTRKIGKQEAKESADDAVDIEDLINEKYLEEGEDDEEEEEEEREEGVEDEEEEEEEEEEEGTNDHNIEDGEERHRNKEDGLVDVEDLGSFGVASSTSSSSSSDPALVSSSSSSSSSPSSSSEPREMVTTLQRKALTKEGYKLIGSHSAVKLCRWTKNQLRGRGGCYKHTMYGITSYQCMETTPSLACANKCVFCWRHHKNPVGKSWRWKVDDPLQILEQSIQKHRQMVKQMRGVPGVQKNRLEEAFEVKHCALSLVGEPIMYPHINTFVKELHRRGISSFLVTNAQFPEKIAELEPVTQLYVSVDAGTKESMKAIDRPLFKDFWERFLSSLRHLRAKGQRTVYRMTLVKSWNMEELTNYCELVHVGRPDFIEIKAVTYCGTSKASSLTMQNVPWHEDVKHFAEAMAQKIGGGLYEVACEHAHSCCVLLARTDKFKKQGKWYTWIDYDRFHQLVRAYYEEGREFTSEEYMAETPQWAVYGAPEAGFDPVETRFYRNRKSGKLVEHAYEPSESGCG